MHTCFFFFVFFDYDVTVDMLSGFLQMDDIRFYHFTYPTGNSIWRRKFNLLRN